MTRKSFKMGFLIGYTILFISALLILSEQSYSAEHSQATCPVMGGPVDKSLYVDYEGKRIYVCCGGCISEVKKDPGKYTEQLEAKGVVLDKTPDAH